MKKQILILLVTFIGSISLVLAQPSQPPIDPSALTAVPTYCTPATPVAATCVPASGPNNPIPGQLYTYTVTVPNPGVNTVFWYVTTDVNFVTAAGLNLANLQTTPTSPYLMATGATYNVAANTTANVDITWQSFPSTQNVFLVTYVKNDITGCTDNIKVYKIEPSFLFTLDINRITNDGTAAALPDHCVSPVLGATYNAGVVEMNFGVNYLYYVVNGANWAHSWLPTFELTSSIGAASTTYAVDWQYPSLANVAAGWHATTAAGNIYTSTDPVTPASATATGVGSAGECIIIRVTVNHFQHQGEAPTTIELAANGTMRDQAAGNYTNALLTDIHHTDGGAGNPCPWHDGYTNDRIAYTLTPRPTVVDNSTPPATMVPDNGQ